MATPYCDIYTREVKIGKIVAAYQLDLVRLQEQPYNFLCHEYLKW